jgi:hypothetical protein
MSLAKDLTRIIQKMQSLGMVEETSNNTDWVDANLVDEAGRPLQMRLSGGKVSLRAAPDLPRPAQRAKSGVGSMAQRGVTVRDRRSGAYVSGPKRAVSKKAAIKKTVSKRSAPKKAAGKRSGPKKA